MVLFDEDLEWQELWLGICAAGDSDAAEREDGGSEYDGTNGAADDLNSKVLAGEEGEVGDAIVRGKMGSGGCGSGVHSCSTLIENETLKSGKQEGRETTRVSQTN